MKNYILTWGVLIASVVFNAFGVFVIKLRLNECGAFKPETLKAGIFYFLALMKSPLVVLGVILFFIAPFLFTIALSRMSLAIAYPVQVGLNFVFLLLLAVFILKESLSLLKIIGIILILLGCFFLIV
ncbi:MAG: EamA family transporter [Candidatus Omnitrophica bacterium]|nr:EamA family transporter [Candidatus Omnitrophota bacterium]